MAPNGGKNQSDALSNQEQDCAKGRIGFGLFIYLFVVLCAGGFESGRVGKTHPKEQVVLLGNTPSMGNFFKLGLY